MTAIREFFASTTVRRKFISIIFYIEAVLTVLVLALVRQAKAQRLVLIYFLLAALISNLIIYYLSERIINLYNMLDRLRQEATTDYLTGLNNVRSFDKSFNELIKKAQENDESISLLTIDIDYFKKVNDTHGHLAGDAVLKELSSIMSNSIRDFDIIARVGGEEFSVLLRDCGQKRTLEIAEKLRRNIESNKFLLPCGKLIQLTVSIGVAVYPATISDIDFLKEKADEKLYEAKHSGRNRVCI